MAGTATTTQEDLMSIDSRIRLTLIRVGKKQSDTDHKLDEAIRLYDEVRGRASAVATEVGFTIPEAQPEAEPEEEEFELEPEEEEATPGAAAAPGGTVPVPALAAQPARSNEHVMTIITSGNHGNQKSLASTYWLNHKQTPGVLERRMAAILTKAKARGRLDLVIKDGESVREFTQRVAFTQAYLQGHNFRFGGNKISIRKLPDGRIIANGLVTLKPTAGQPAPVAVAPVAPAAPPAAPTPTPQPAEVPQPELKKEGVFAGARQRLAGARQRLRDNRFVDPRIQRQFDDRARTIRHALYEKHNPLLLFKVKRLDYSHPEYLDEWKAYKANFLPRLKQKAVDKTLGRIHRRLSAKTSEGQQKTNATRLQKFYSNQIVERVSRTRDNFRKKKDEDMGLAQLVLRGLFRSVTQAIGDAIKLVRRVVKVTGNALSETNTGKRIVNATTAIYRDAKASVMENVSEPVRRGMTRVGEVVEKYVKPPAQFVSRQVTRVYRATATTVELGKEVATGTKLGVMTGVAGFVVAGPAGGLAFGLGGTAIGAWNASLESRSKFSFGYKEGYGRFRDVDGNWNMKLKADSDLIKELRQQGSVFSDTAHFVRSLNAGLQIASIGAIIGSLAGGGLGGALLGAGIGFVGGAGGRYLIDRFIVGPNAANRMINAAEGNSTFWGHLAKLPAMTIFNQSLAQGWLQGQLWQLFGPDGPHKSLGQFWKDNYSFGDASGIEGFINVGGNYLGALTYVQGTAALTNYALETFGGNAFTDVKNASYEWFGQKLGMTALEGGGEGAEAFVRTGGLGGVLQRFATSELSGIFNPMTIGAVAGSIIGTVAAVAIGLPFGPAAMIGATIGAIIGTGLGIALSIAIPGVGVLLSGVIVSITTALGQLGGQWLGGQLDRVAGDAINGALNSVMMVIEGLSAMLSMVSLIVNGINLNNILPLVMALISLGAYMKHSSLQNGVNSCLANCPAPAVGSLNTLDLANYNTYLISNGSYWTADNVRTIIGVLDDMGPNYQQLLGTRKLVITMGKGNDYIDKKLAVVALTTDDLTSTFNLRAQLTGKLNIVAQEIQSPTMGNFSNTDAQLTEKQDEQLLNQLAQY